MPLSKQLFRESALERLSSPEQLDQLLQITSPKGWISLISIWALLFVIIAWTIFGKVLTKEDGRGIIVAGAGLELIEAGGSGRVGTIDVRVNDTVAEGQIVATIEKYDILDQILEAEARKKELERQKEQLDELDLEEESIEQQLADEERKLLDSVIDFSKKRHERLDGHLVKVLELIQSGTMSEIDRHKVEEEIESSIAARQAAELRKEQLKAGNSTASARRTREQLQRLLEIQEITSRIEALESRRNRESNVICEVDGRVVEIRVAEGTAVTVGEPMLVIEPTRISVLEAVLYVSAETGKVIKKGMKVEVSPSTVKQEEYGSIKGTVKDISSVPTSKAAMLKTLSRDRDLVDQFTSEIGLPLEMIVSLNVDENTRSRLEWTTKEGPPHRVSAGTLCTGSVTVEENSPLHLVFPRMKREPDAE